MDEFNTSLNTRIAEAVESGEYYKDALKWYQVKYHSPIVERCFFIVIAAMAIATTYFSVQGFRTLFPISVDIPVIVDVANPEDKAIRVESISKGNDLKSVNSGLRRYYVADYVADRERYFASSLEKQVKHVKLLSAPDVYQIYRKRISPSNPNSPVVRFERHTAMDVSIRTLEIAFLENKPQDNVDLYEATVEFSTVIVNSTMHKSMIEPEFWEATLKFEYKDLQVDQKTGDIIPMEFLVTDYQVKRRQANSKS